MAGTLAIRQKWLLPTPSIHDGGTAPSSSTGEAKLLLFFLASEPKNLSTGSLRKCGHSPETALPCASLTSGTMTRVTGIAPMAMKTGSSMTMGLWRHGMRPSMSSPGSREDVLCPNKLRNDHEPSGDAKTLSSCCLDWNIHPIPTRFKRCKLSP